MLSQQQVVKKGFEPNRQGTRYFPEKRRNVMETEETPDLQALIDASVKEALKPPPTHPCDYCRAPTREGDTFCDRCINAGMVAQLTPEDYEEYRASYKMVGKLYYRAVGLIERVPSWQDLSPAEMREAYSLSYGFTVPGPLPAAEKAALVEDLFNKTRANERAAKALAQERRVERLKKELAEAITVKVK